MDRSGRAESGLARQGKVRSGIAALERRGSARLAWVRLASEWQ